MINFEITKYDHVLHGLQELREILTLFDERLIILEKAVKKPTDERSNEKVPFNFRLCSDCTMSQCSNRGSVIGCAPLCSSDF